MNIKGNAGEVRATIQVTRAATGEVETYELVGAVDAAQATAVEGMVKRTRVHNATGAVAGLGAKLSNRKEQGK